MIIKTAVPPQELLEIAKKRNINVGINVINVERRKILVLYVVEIEGEVEKFLEELSKARAGG
ncbi:TIGR04140 family protein [Pyrococcus furiosus DSM 3638]|uniref:TIGR04140 family protein n=2 Tax=Pyrococcus furiosus TaxID=2261 RepID=A0A5C0XR85_PYRFU|nr:TIGR04140 family protein [Pyrococcus furiosus]AFN04885.1 hypothetical protein PFC_09820 [Pyrococcus furiosus COM1]QEK79357.1 TIGR04140 family protein [Pyrococcus furiosus DSM 3638]